MEQLVHPVCKLLLAILHLVHQTIFIICEIVVVSLDTVPTQHTWPLRIVAMPVFSSIAVRGVTGLVRTVQVTLFRAVVVVTATLAAQINT
jgi:hypothetical protein